MRTTVITYIAKNSKSIKNIMGRNFVLAKIMLLLVLGLAFVGEGCSFVGDTSQVKPEKAAQKYADAVLKNCNENEARQLIEAGNLSAMRSQISFVKGQKITYSSTSQVQPRKDGSWDVKLTFTQLKIGAESYTGIYLIRVTTDGKISYIELELKRKDGTEFAL